ncbi:MAG: adenylosuccinate synthase [Sedimentisphaerales bacterium]|nr:adenylosuccinate synthase [Sedimentisphaerales bacterium]
MNTCIVGLQWGDEGKGKVVDLLSESADLVARYSGGANAGHTVLRDSREKAFALHLLPSGILRDDVLCVITNGVALDAETLLAEIDQLAARGIGLKDNLRISSRAHLVMDYHKRQDRYSEEALGADKIGTTVRGIGPCYADKVTRTTAVRLADLLDLEGLEKRLRPIVDQKNAIFAALYPGAEPIDADAILDQCRRWAERLGAMITDTTALLHRAWKDGRSMLFEGAQGTLLDLDHGTFPFVTSSNASACGFSAGSGLPARAVDRFLGVAKAYSTRVGAGPFPSEQDNHIGQYIRDKGHEYGTTTGRPRRCGWFDAVCVRYSIQIGAITEVALQHLDTLAGLDEIKVCTGYRRRGEIVDFFPAERQVLDEVECRYETLAGFSEDITQARRFEDLPANAQNYVRRLEEILETPVTMIGVGPSRDQMVYRTGA